MTKFRSSGGIEMDYPARLPKVVPVGSFLVHNDPMAVRGTRKQGNRGARFWLQTTHANLERCTCTWAPEPIACSW